MHHRELLTAVTACLLAGSPAGVLAGDPAPDGYVEPEQVELTDADYAEIQRIMVDNAPILSSSPGIKTSQAERVGERISAQVYFYPYAESGGIARAVKAYCVKDGPDAPWACPNGDLRSYLQVPGQEFQVRVSGDIDYDGALALIERTGEALRAYPNPEFNTADTAILIVPMENAVDVAWGDNKGFAHVSLTAVPVPGAEQRNPQGWRVVSVNNEPWEYPPADSY